VTNIVTVANPEQSCNCWQIVKKHTELSSHPGSLCWALTDWFNKAKTLKSLL